MQRVTTLFAVAILWCIPSSGQQSPATPQTARQALIEMLFSKTPGTFAKHLPAATLAAIEKSGAMATLQQYSLLASKFQAQGPGVQTFETGPVLFAGQDQNTGQKFEVKVENDALHGDDDDLQLSFQVYKDGQVQKKTYMPQMTFSMKKEAQIWTLNEVTVTIHVPLADPELLNAITENMRPQTGVHTTFISHSETPAQPAGSDAMVTAAMHTILNAEVTYANTYSTVGYTCTLSNLDGFGGGEPNAHLAMLISSSLAGGKRYGFVFALSECSGTPATSFLLTATPGGNSFGRKAFCADQSGVIRSSDEGNTATCQASGTPVQ
jgi:hypothetical protein